MNINLVQICGRITKNPEIKTMPSGQAVANFGIATNRTWKDANGVKQTAADFHSIVSFGKRAEVIGQYCHQGDEIYISGRLSTRSWQGQDGVKHYKTEVIAEDFQFGQKKKVENTAQPAPKNYDDGQQDIPVFEDEPIDVKDIPF